MWFEGFGGIPTLVVNLRENVGEEQQISIKFHKEVAKSIKERDPEKAESDMEILLKDAQKRLKNRLVISY